MGTCTVFAKKHFKTDVPNVATSVSYKKDFSTEKKSALISREKNPGFNVSDYVTVLACFNIQCFY